MNKIQHVMANIKIPIQINKNGETELLIDLMSIELNKCDTLPEKTIENIKELSLIDQINIVLMNTNNNVMPEPEPEIINSNIEPQEPTVTEPPEPVSPFLSKDEIKPQKHRIRKNTSFKNKTQNHYRHTSKAR